MLIGRFNIMECCIFCHILYIYYIYDKIHNIQNMMLFNKCRSRQNKPIRSRECGSFWRRRGGTLIKRGRGGGFGVGGNVLFLGLVGGDCLPSGMAPDDPPCLLVFTLFYSAFPLNCEMNSLTHFSWIYVMRGHVWDEVERGRLWLLSWMPSLFCFLLDQLPCRAFRWDCSPSWQVDYNLKRGEPEATSWMMPGLLTHRSWEITRLLF